MGDRVELSELIRQVADELRQVHDEEPEFDAVMQFAEAEIDVTATVEKEGKAGIRIYVVERGSGANIAGSVRIKVKFTSIEDVVIAALTAAISSDSSEAPLHSERNPPPRVDKQTRRRRR